MSLLLRLFHNTRHHSRFIQSVILAFVLSLGAAIAAPAVQAQNLSPDQQLICVGSGGMKVITFAADGSAQETDSAHASDCAMCEALQAVVPTPPIQQGLQAAHFATPLLASAFEHLIFQPRAPPVRAPPAI